MRASRLSYEERVALIESLTYSSTYRDRAPALDSLVRRGLILGSPSLLSGMRYTTTEASEALARRTAVEEGANCSLVFGKHVEDARKARAAELEKEIVALENRLVRVRAELERANAGEPVGRACQCWRCIARREYLRESEVGSEGHEV